MSPTSRATPVAMRALRKSGENMPRRQGVLDSNLRIERQDKGLRRKSRVCSHLAARRFASNCFGPFLDFANRDERMSLEMSRFADCCGAPHSFDAGSSNPALRLLNPPTMRTRLACVP